MQWNEELLGERLTTPSPRLVEDMKKVSGDILVLGAGGKMGPTLCVLAQKALRLAGNEAKVIAVSRFSDPIAVTELQSAGVELISADLMADGALETLPDAPNVVYMAGRKFGTQGQEALTWAMNATLPALVARRFRTSRIVVFSTGNVYPQVALHSGGATEETAPSPTGEYAMSCLARERAFEYAAQAYGTSIALYRLNYAIDLRYGVLHDLCSFIMRDVPVPLNMPVFNCIWQGDACEAALRLLLYASPEVFRLNVTGPEMVSVRAAATKLATLLGKPVTFSGEEDVRAQVVNAQKMCALIGYPSVSLDTLMRWQAEWILSGGRALNKPTHFEEKEGTF